MVLYFVSKIVLNYCHKKLFYDESSVDIKNLFGKLETEGHKFTIFLKSIEQLI